VIRSKYRDALQKHLTVAGIGTMIHYPTPLHLQPAYTDMNLPQGHFPIAETIQHEILSLPMGPSLTLEQAKIVVKAVRDFCQ
jgi:dTDP-4-amino-4,6-dideoxygalactose transaminase